jgi:hypothetical protein
MHDEGEFINPFARMALTTSKEEHVIASMKTDNLYSLSAEKFSRIWGIGISVAKRTLKAMMQKGMRTVVFPSVEGRKITGDRPLCYRRLSLHLYPDTLKSSIKSLWGNTCNTIYTSLVKNIKD